MRACGWAIGPARGAALLGLILLCGAAGAAVGQAEEAILQRGPVAVRSLPFFPPNALRAYQGEYRVPRQSGDWRVVVYFTRESLVLPAAWREVRCGQSPLRRVTSEEGFTLCHAEPGEAGWFVFLTFESEDFHWCGWTESFLARFRYLLPFARGESEVPFPAVLEFRER